MSATTVPNPIPQGEELFSLPLPHGDLIITNTVVSTWVVMVVMFIVVFMAHRSLKKGGLLSGAFLDIVARLDTYTTELFESQESARKFLFMVGGFFLFIVFGNLIGLIFDFLGLLSHHVHTYLRPIHSDLNTAITMAALTIIVSQVVAIRHRGFFAHFKHYLFNFTGSSAIEKPVNVFVGWLHFIGEFIRIGSLSMRLFLNIFVGVILISVMAYIGASIPVVGPYLGGFLVLPIWFFELLVAFLQGFIFLTLASLYLREALVPVHHDDEHAEHNGHA